MPSWKKVIISGSNAALNSLNVSTSLTASGIIYPTTDGASGQVVITDGNGNLSFSNIENTTITIKNVSGGTIAKGTPCYITGSGTSGNIAGVWPADASNPLRMPAGVIAGESLTAGAEGVGLINGFINGVDTSAFAAGDSVYVAPGGGYTNVKPTGSSVLIQKLGNVEKSAINGSGVINGPGYYNEVPNIQQGYTWVGNSNGVAVAVATSSIQNVVSASFALTASVAATSVITTQDTTPITYNVVFTGGSSGNHSLNVDTTTLTYNPSTTTFTCPNLTGTATTASNITPAITNAANNRVLTSNGGGTINGESNLTFNGTSLVVTGSGGRSIALEGGGAGRIDINGDGSAYAVGIKFNSQAGGTALSGIWNYGSGTTQQWLAIGGTEYNNAALYILPSGYVGIATSAPSYPLHVSASASGTSIYATGDIVAFSDQSVKENIRPIENVLERIGDSRGILYDRVDNGEKDNIGFIAQELEVAFPELVVTNPDGTKAVKYQNAVAVLFEAVKEQQKQINEILTLLNK